MVVLFLISGVHPQISEVPVARSVIVGRFFLVMWLVHLVSAQWHDPTLMQAGIHATLLQKTLS